MQLITLEIADNGIIKTISDDNINGAGESFEIKTIYNLEKGDIVETKMELLYELSEDMGMHLGNSKQPDQIQIVSGWGEHYEPAKEEIAKRIEEIESDLIFYKKLHDSL